MKIVINACYGGFSLSRAAVKRLAELQGRDAYFFTQRGGSIHAPYQLISDINADADAFMWAAFDIPNPDEVIGRSFVDEDGTYKTFNELYSKHSLSQRPDDRTDTNLVRVVEELGAAANDRYAELKVIEIPDGTEWEIDEYDGIETVHEKHKSWS